VLYVWRGAKRLRPRVKHAAPLAEGAA
jgi:hypothetical protein